MKNVIKHSGVLKGIPALCVAIILLSGCNSSTTTESTTDSTVGTDTNSMMMAPTDTTMKDSLPPVDSTATTKPDGGKTK